MTIDQIVSRLKARKTGVNWQARCPAHNDKNPSLVISQGVGGKTVVHCHAGCPAESVAAAMGITVSDLFDDATKPTENDQPRNRTLILTKAADIKEEPVMWVWENRIKQGATTLLVGPEGIGKGLFAVRLAAGITLGLIDGVHRGKPRSVIISSTEDEWADTIKPRLMAVGADCSRVFRLGVSDGSTFTIPGDLPRIDEIIRENDVALVILDPLLSHMDGRADSYKARDVRKALEPMRPVAEATGVAVLGIMHVSKRETPNLLDKVSDSKAFTQIARSALFMAEDPHDENIRLVSQGKNNNGPKSSRSVMAFTIESVDVGTNEDGWPIRVGKLVQQADREGSARDIMTEALDNTRRQPVKSRTDDASTWLKDYLTEHGEVDSVTVKTAALEAGYSDSTLLRARQRIGAHVTSRDFPRRSFWSLPEPQSRQDMDVERGHRGVTDATEATGVNRENVLNITNVSGTLYHHGHSDATVTPVTPVTPVGPTVTRSAPSRATLSTTEPNHGNGQAGMLSVNDVQAFNPKSAFLPGVTEAMKGKAS